MSIKFDELLEALNINEELGDPKLPEGFFIDGIDDDELYYNEECVGSVWDDATIQLFNPEDFSQDTIKELAEWSRDCYGSAMVVDEAENDVYVFNESLNEDFWNPSKEFIEFNELLNTEFDESGWNNWNQEERDNFAEMVAKRYLEINPTPTPLFFDDLTDNNFHTYRKAFEKLLSLNESLNESFGANSSFKFDSDKDTIDFISKLENYFIQKGVNAYSYYDTASNSWKIGIDKKEFALTISDPVFHLFEIDNSRSLHDWSNMDYDDLLKDCIYAIESNL